VLFSFTAHSPSQIYTLSLHDALPISWLMSRETVEWMHRYVSGVLLVQIRDGQNEVERQLREAVLADTSKPLTRGFEELTSPPERSEEHTSELQSRGHLVCRLLLEKKK